MAIPTIVRVLPVGYAVGDPVEGPTAGRQLVEIYGSNFRLPSTDPVPPTPGQIFVVAPVPRTVSVTFGGVEATDVQVIKSNLLRATTPPSPISTSKANDYGQGTVDVVVTNLDDDEDPIVGETVTLVDGYLYRRPLLDAASQSDFLRLVRTLIQEMKRQVTPQVVLTTNTDWDADTASQIVDLPSLPALVLVGPRTPENRFYGLTERPEVQNPDESVEVRRVPRTVDLAFEVVGIADDAMTLLNLMAAANQFVKENIEIEMDRDPDDLSLGKVSYEFDFESGSSFDMSGVPNPSNIVSFSGTVVLKGFDFEGFASFSGAALRDLSRSLVEDVSLDAESF